MSAVRAPRDPKHSPRHHRPSARKDAKHLRLPEDGSVEGGISPARQLQTDLAERLQKPRPISLRATLATILVVCLAMSFATLSLLTSS